MLVNSVSRAPYSPEKRSQRPPLLRGPAASLPQEPPARPPLALRCADAPRSSALPAYTLGLLGLQLTFLSVLQTSRQVLPLPVFSAAFFCSSEETLGLFLVLLSRALSLSGSYFLFLCLPVPHSAHLFRSTCPGSSSVFLSHF